MIDPAILVLGICRRELKTHSHKNLCISVHNSIIRNSQKVETAQVSVNWRVDKQKVAYLWNEILHYLEIIRNELLVYAATWMNLKNIMLSEKNQMQKTVHRTMPLI